MGRVSTAIRSVTCMALQQHRIPLGGSTSARILIAGVAMALLGVAAMPFSGDAGWGLLIVGGLAFAGGCAAAVAALAVDAWRHA